MKAASCIDQDEEVNSQGSKIVIMEPQGMNDHGRQPGRPPADQRKFLSLLSVVVVVSSSSSPSKAFQVYKFGHS